jgi:hypothetical protein
MKYLVICFLLGIVLSGCFGSVTESKGLTELQITACNSADAGGTCDTRLAEVDLVSKEDCCSILGECC